MYSHVLPERFKHRLDEVGKVVTTNPPLIKRVQGLNHPTAEMIQARTEMLPRHYFTNLSANHTVKIHFSQRDSATAGDKSDGAQTESTPIPRSNGAVTG